MGCGVAQATIFLLGVAAVVTACASLAVLDGKLPEGYTKKHSKRLLAFFVTLFCVFTVSVGAMDDQVDVSCAEGPK